jgi:hypothetical protein
MGGHCGKTHKTSDIFADELMIWYDTYLVRVGVKMVGLQ